MDARNPAFHVILRQWYARSRIEEGQEMANALATTENQWLHAMFRNKVVNNKLLEDGEILQGLNEMSRSSRQTKQPMPDQDVIVATEELEVAKATLTTEIQALVGKAGDIEIV